CAGRLGKTRSRLLTQRRQLAFERDAYAFRGQISTGGDSLSMVFQRFTPAGLKAVGESVETDVKRRGELPATLYQLPGQYNAPTGQQRQRPQGQFRHTRPDPFQPSHSVHS